MGSCGFLAERFLSRHQKQEPVQKGENLSVTDEVLEAPVRYI